MKDEIKFSLSYYFEELQRREQEKSQPNRSSEPTMTNILSVLKALKNAEGNSLKITALAKYSKLKLGVCQEITEYLENEGLAETEPDSEGNDVIRLTEKGLNML